MVLTTDPVIRVTPRISRTNFVSILTEQGDPYLQGQDFGACFDVIAAQQVDPLFALAIFQHESQFGKTGICHQYRTFSPGNSRSTRTGVGTLISKTVAYIKYPDLPEGFRDLAYRLVDPTYVYAQQGLVTPAQILPVFAPVSDGNDPAAYSNAVAQFMSAYEQNQETNVQIFGWPVVVMPAASGNFDTSRTQVRLLVIHDEEASTAQSAVNRFQTPNEQASAHWINDYANQRYVQCVDPAYTAYAVGNYDFNQASESIENPGFAAGTYPDAEVDSCAKLAAARCYARGIPVRWLTPEQVAAGKWGICGHQDIPSVDGTHLGGNEGHGDPGANWPRAHFIQLVTQYLQQLQGTQVNTTPPPPQGTPPTYFHQTGHWLAHGFQDFWVANGGLTLFGYPLSEEYTDERGIVVQWFERARFEWQPTIAQNPQGVVLGLLGSEDKAQAEAAHPDAFARKEPT